MYLSPINASIFYTDGLIESNLPRRARVPDASAEASRQPQLARAGNTAKSSASTVFIRIESASYES